MYKDLFDGYSYVTNTGDIMVRVVLNRRDISGQGDQIHPALIFNLKTSRRTTFKNVSKSTISTFDHCIPNLGQILAPYRKLGIFHLTPPFYTFLHPTRYSVMSADTHTEPDTENWGDLFYDDPPLLVLS